MEIPSLDELDTHHKKLNIFKSTKEIKSNFYENRPLQTYFAPPELLIQPTKLMEPKEVYKEEPKKFEYLTSLAKAHDELRDNIQTIQGTLQISKSRLQANITNSD